MSDPTRRLSVLAAGAWLMSGGFLCAQEQPPAAPQLTPALRVAATLQIALDRHAFGVGLIDGHLRLKSRQALVDFRYASDGLSDSAARQVLLDETAPAFVRYTVVAADLDQVGDCPTDWETVSQLSAMTCRSLLEWLSEKFHAKQDFLRQLNPQVADWNADLTGETLWVPNVRPDKCKLDVKQITIDTHIFRLRGYDAAGRVTCSFPCSIARDRAKVPEGELRVANVAPNPNYTFDPVNFPESARAQQIGHKLILPPGPRNPVGIYWMSLSQPGYGIHGTPHPDTIGNMESHGCFRLCNWDARTLGQTVALGVPVYLDDAPRTLAAR